MAHGSPSTWLVQGLPPVPPHTPWPHELSARVKPEPHPPRPPPLTHQHHHTPVQDATVVAEAAVRAEQGILYAVAPVRAGDGRTLVGSKATPTAQSRTDPGPGRHLRAQQDPARQLGPDSQPSPLHPLSGEGRPGASSRDHPGPPLQAPGRATSWTGASRPCSTQEPSLTPQRPWAVER